jgi:hypothetical protein
MSSGCHESRPPVMCVAGSPLWWLTLNKLFGMVSLGGMLYHKWYNIIEVYCKWLTAAVLEIPAAFHLVQGPGK